MPNERQQSLVAFLNSDINERNNNLPAGTYIYKMFGKEKKILANDVVLRKVSVFGKDFETVEYNDGRIMTLPDRKKYASWRDFLRKKIDSLAVRHEVIPLGISRSGVIAGKPQLEP